MPESELMPEPALAGQSAGVAVLAYGLFLGAYLGNRIAGLGCGGLRDYRRDHSGSDGQRFAAAGA